MKKLIQIFSTLIIIVITSCGTASKLKENRTWLKEYAFCKCFEYASKDTAFFKNDMGASVYVEIASYDRKVFSMIDSLANQAASEIKPSEIADYNNKKATLSDCFLFQKSKRLDSLIKSLDKFYINLKYEFFGAISNVRLS